MPYPRYTKADLEQIVGAQLENLNANKKLNDEIEGFKKKIKPYPNGHRKQKS
jgi:hypothetical protein